MQEGSRIPDCAVTRSARRAALNSSDRLGGVFRRRAPESSAPLALLDDVDRLRVAEWCQMAVDRVQAGPRETSWLTATIMVQMTLGYAVNARSRVPPLAYALITRTGYVLRMLVGHIAPPRPLDVSSIDRASIVKLATLPRDEEIGTLADAEEEDEALLLPIVMLVSDTAEHATRFTDVASVKPALWNACVEVAVLHMQDQLTESGIIRRRRDVGRDVVESFLRYGFVLRCVDEAFAINTHHTTH